MVKYRIPLRELKLPKAYFIERMCLKNLIPMIKFQSVCTFICTGVEILFFLNLIFHHTVNNENLQPLVIKFSVEELFIVIKSILFFFF